MKTLSGHYILLHVSSESSPFALSHKKDSRLIHAMGNFREYLRLFFSEQIAVLKGHTGLVKGVTWDPVGKYLASQVTFSLFIHLLGFTICMLGRFFLLSADFFNINFFKKFFKEYHQSVNEDRQSVSPDLGPKCL